MSGFTVERRCGSCNGGNFLRRDVGRQPCWNRTLKLLPGFYQRGRFAAIKIAGRAGHRFARFCFPLRGPDIWPRDGEAILPTGFPIAESVTGRLLNRRQRLGETAGLLRLRSSDNLIFQLGERRQQFGRFKRLDDEGLNGSSLPTVSNTGILAVSGDSFTRWQTSRPP
jgi:hypothetical protein